MEDNKLAIKTSKMYVYHLKKSSLKYKTGRVTPKHISINDTENFTQLLAIMPIQDAKPAWNRELGLNETNELCSKLSKSTRRNV